MQIKLNDCSMLLKYNLINQIVTPRPIAWISTVSEDGVINIAPYDFFAPLSSDPMVFAVSFFSKSDGSLKDTFTNIVKTKRASICLCDLSVLKAMHKSAQELDSKQSEAAYFDIAMEVVIQDYPPVPKEIKAAFMCEYYDLLPIGQINKVLLLEAKECFIQDSIYKSNLDFNFKAIARVGSNYLIGTNFISQNELS